MSGFRLPKRRNEDHAALPPTNPVPARNYHHRVDWSNRPLVFLPYGRTLTQANVPPHPNQSGFVSNPVDLDPGETVLRRPAEEDSTHYDEFYPQEFSIRPLPSFDDWDHATPGSTNRLKKARQWERWQTEVLPALIPIYLRFLQSSDNAEPPHPCTCKRPSRKLQITVLRFDVLERLTISTCSCRSAPTQLVPMGLFPCAPVAPTLAVDMRVLDFVSRLFVHIPPNNTAWCQTVEEFLDSRGHKLATRVCSDISLSFES
ncbi:hypothetical protein BDN72DRAFT_765598 [Pluteus cervinus]|uniref:Uncharacterized protein n=1 Tax=Pluteus cervinus TaxID=181527 RepID=A0ACD3B0J7_9AGAR|nr:hypothetical protein BDN72DRAFT_765598 [Pluteus cervinus]